MNGMAGMRRAVTGMAGALVVGLASLGASAAETPATIDGVKVVTAEQAKAMLDKGVPFIDARVASEYAEKTIKGAKSVTYHEKSAKAVDFDRNLDQFDVSKLPADKNAPFVVFCNSGECWKSYKAAVVSRDAGYKQIQWLRGGMPEWVAKGLPTQ
jgi:rhodanese-related sulfurtransferase